MKGLFREKLVDRPDMFTQGNRFMTFLRPLCIGGVNLNGKVNTCQSTFSVERHQKGSFDWQMH